MTNQELRQSLNLINQAIPKKNSYEKIIWRGIANLIEKSEFGTKNTKIDIHVINGKENISDSESLNKFENIQIKALEICTSIFEDHGNVKLIPYSKGMLSGKKCMTLRFIAK